MDMYYRLKEDLLCQDCKIDLKFEEQTGAGYFTASCIGCGAKVEVEIFTRVVFQTILKEKECTQKS